LLLTSCSIKDPANQWLDSFHSDLKDPDSGKVFDFEGNILTYTATNSYGARIQGKALCGYSIIEKGKWGRDVAGEYLQILKLTTKKLENSNACRESCRSWLECAGDSQVLKRAAISRTSPAQSELEDEAARELGYK